MALERVGKLKRLATFARRGQHLPAHQLRARRRLSGEISLMEMVLCVCLANSSLSPMM